MNKISSNTIKPKLERPNIDHLIKRILDERRKYKKKSILSIIFALIILSGITLYFKIL
jgi:hypothetical protein